MADENVISLPHVSDKWGRLCSVCRDTTQVLDIFIASAKASISAVLEAESKPHLYLVK